MCGIVFSSFQGFGTQGPFSITTFRVVAALDPLHSCSVTDNDGTAQQHCNSATINRDKKSSIPPHSQLVRTLSFDAIDRKFWTGSHASDLREQWFKETQLCNDLWAVLLPLVVSRILDD